MALVRLVTRPVAFERQLGDRPAEDEDHVAQLRLVREFRQE